MAHFEIRENSKLSMLALNNLVFFNDAVTALDTVKRFVTHNDVTEQVMELVPQYERMVCSLGACSLK